MERFGLNGLSGYDTKRILIVEDLGKRLLTVEGRRYMCWSLGDALAEHFAIAQLCALEVASHQEIADAFHLSVKSVYHYAHAFELDGSNGLWGTKKGPKSRWKITPEIRAKILYLYFEKRIVEYERIKKYLADWGEDIGISSIRLVLKENGLVREVVVFDDLATPAELLHTEATDKQPELEFDWTDWVGAIHDEKSEFHPFSKRAKTDDELIRPSSISKRQYSSRQRVYLNQLKQGCYSSYAGGLLFTPFLSRYPFLPTLKNIIDISAHEGYSLEELAQTLFYFDVFGYRSMEDFKRVYPEEFGLLIGASTSPSHFTLRRFLHMVRKREISEALIEEFAQMYLREGLVKWGVLYIDAHFLPYHGKYPVSKGWHGVRQIAMKGSYHFLGVDEQFLPWIFLVRSSAEDLLEKIPEMIEKAKNAAHRAGIEQQAADEMVVVFDREGFSGPLYGYLDGRDRDDKRKRAFFVSWAKYSDKWVYEIPEKDFEHEIVVHYDSREKQRLRYCETERRMSKYGKIRAVVIEKPIEKKRMAIYTNGRSEQISGERVVQLMCRRWGQENLIKELMGKHYINYMPGYVREPMDEQPLVDNPQMKELKARRSAVTGELHALKVQLADKMMKDADEQAIWKEIKRKEIRLLEEIVKRENEILLLDNEAEKLPAKIPFDQAHHGRKLEKLNYEKKRFLDCIKVYSYNAQNMMCKLLLEHYGREKELFPALSMIVKRGGVLQLQGSRLRVRLQRFKNAEIDYAARCLCEDLNEMNPATLDRYRLPLWFEVS